ncbi:SDR family oxidoreductase [Microbacterium sp. B2969]|uniref:SDR family oxidoreductase n=1 Tax=Microbacterium alkaliflavum TaxID=3248839 RepID=A0ABW7QEI7_9MICO
MGAELALVTGATRGIGRAVALQLLDRGYRVIASGRDASSLAHLGREAGVRPLETAVLDIDRADVTTQVASALSDRPLALLVLNAARFAPWEESVSGADLAQAERVFATNVFGTWRVLQAALPAVRRAGGTVIAVGSGSGSHGDPRFGVAANPGAASYAASKAALHALMHKLAAEVGGEGVRVFVTDPGLTATSPGMEDFGARPVADGARSVLAPLDGAVEPGSLTRDGLPLPW